MQSCLPAAFPANFVSHRNLLTQGTPSTADSPEPLQTRSGKIMRRILRKIASLEDKDLGDTSSLQDPTVVQALIELRGK